MYRRLFVLVFTVILVICLEGCIENKEKTTVTENVIETTGNETVEVNEGKDTQTVSKEENVKETPLTNINDTENYKAPCMSLENDVGEEYILCSYFTVNDIMLSFELGEEAIEEKFEGTVSFSNIGGAGNSSEEFYNEEYGLYFIIQSKQDVQYIEIDPEKVSLLGITQKSDFEDVKAVLGETEVLINVNDLLGLKRYEVVYEYNDNYLRIYSFDELGESGLYFSFTDEYKSKHGFFNITSNDIASFFNMTMDEIQKELGIGTKPYDYRLEYEDYEVFFDFNNEGSELKEIGLHGMYQIEGLREYMFIDKTQSIMGKGEVIEHMTSEDGMLTILKYDFDDFVLKVNYLLGEDEFPWWDILRKE